MPSEKRVRTQPSDRNKGGAGRTTKASMLLLVLRESQQGKVMERKWDRNAREHYAGLAQGIPSFLRLDAVQMANLFLGGKIGNAIYKKKKKVFIFNTVIPLTGIYFKKLFLSHVLW